MDPKVKEYLSKKPQWSKGLKLLRKVILQTGLDETIKWGAPVYQMDKKNIVGLASFNAHFGLWFFQGYFLKDKKKLLVNAQEGKTKAMRQLRFNSFDEVNEKIVTQYVKEAIDNHKNGLVVKKVRKPVTYELAPELNSEFSNNLKLKKAFYEASPYKQKEYSNYISDAKRAETKTKRLIKILPLIKEGKSIY